MGAPTETMLEARIRLPAAGPYDGDATVGAGGARRHDNELFVGSCVWSWRTFGRKGRINDEFEVLELQG